MNLYPFEMMDFNSAAKMTAIEISKNFDNLYLAYSGGYDSDFVMHAFCERNVPITPIIVRCNNEKENTYAFETCKKFNVEPIIIATTEEKLLEIFANDISKKLNSPAFNSSYNVLISQYVMENNGTLLLGEHFLGDGDDIIVPKEFSLSNEWDFYWTALFPEISCIDFFLYTIELTYSAFPFNDIGTRWKDYKSRLFSLEKRDKMKPEWSKENLEKIKQLNSQRPYSPKTGIRYSLVDIHNIFDKYSIND